MSVLHEAASLFAVLDSMLLAYAACVAAGRLAGFLISLVCGAGVAYYVMPPIFSFSLSTHDAAMLTVYGLCCLGLIVMKPGRGARDNRKPGNAPSSSPMVSLNDLVGEEVLADLRSRRIAVAVEEVEFPGTREEASRVLSDLFASAMEVTGLRRISIEAGVLPSARLLVLTAHHVWPPPMPERVTIGRHENKCEPVAFPRWPASIRGTRFDNGYGRVYQVFVEAQGDGPRVRIAGGAGPPRV